MTTRIISYGGGVQSSAMVVLAATNPLFNEAMGGPVTHAVFSNTGDDSEKPATLTYIREVMAPWAAERGVEVVELQRTFKAGKRKGEKTTLRKELMRPESRSIDIPVRMKRTGAPGHRNCTGTFKIKVIADWTRNVGKATKDDPAQVAIGISTDEMERAKGRSTIEWETPAYPLLDMGISRSDCQIIIQNAGLPVPPKSTCYFCPFHTPQGWAEMRRDEPDLFHEAAIIERTLTARSEQLGREPVYLSQFGKPLDEAIDVAQDQLFTYDSLIGESGCDSGNCWT